MHNNIARRFLLPKELGQNGLSEEHGRLTEPALLRVVTHYAREVGVRAQERAIGGVVRFKVVKWMADVDAGALLPSSRPSSPALSDANGALIQTVRNGDSGYDPVVEVDQLEKILGLSPHDDEDRDLETRRGVVWDLVVTGMGEIISVGSIATPSNGNLKLIGSLGDVRFFSSCFSQKGRGSNLGVVV